MARAGEVVTYGAAHRALARAARLMRGLGAEHGDTVAILLENHPRYLELAWAAQRAGLRYTAISPRLTADEVAYILEDSARGCCSRAPRRPRSRGGGRPCPGWPR